MDGLLLVDKPIGITSFDVIRRLRFVTGIKKIGHAGTLDPLATGLMLILIGGACKKAESLTKLDKRYIADIRLGFNSTTGDEEGEKIKISSKRPIRSDIEKAIVGFTGDISQTPSIYSAIKIKGKEAYKYARAGQSVEVPVRKVTVHELVAMGYEYPSLTLVAHVSSGTYIRSLAEDMGKVLETGAYLGGLIRTEIGDYCLEDAIALDDCTIESVQNKLISLD